MVPLPQLNHNAMSKRILNVSLVVVSLLLISFFACKNNLTGPDNPAPKLLVLPDFTSIFPPFPFNLGRGALSNETNFFSAADKVNNSLYMIFTFWFKPNDTFLQGTESEPYYKEGQWIWEWNTLLPRIMDMKLTAKKTDEQTNWELLESFTVPNLVVENRKRFSGYVNNDSTMGEWVFFDYYTEADYSEPKMQINWTHLDNSNFTLDVSVTDFDFFLINGFVYSKFTMMKNSPENRVLLTRYDSQEYEVYWNEDTGTGYYKEGGKPKVCWDEDYLNTPC